MAYCKGYGKRESHPEKVSDTTKGAAVYGVRQRYLFEAL